MITITIRGNDNNNNNDYSKLGWWIINLKAANSIIA